jgi:hypothetical protein
MLKTPKSSKLLHKKKQVSYPPLQDFDDSLLYDLGNEEEMDEPLNVLNPPCYDTDTDIVDIDEFIHVGRRKWDVVGFDMDPIYDIENHFQVSLCSGLDRSKDIVCLKKDPCDNFLQPPMITLLCCVSRGVVGRYVFCIEFPLGKTLESKGWLNTSRISLSSQLFNFPLGVCQSSTRSFSIPSQAFRL